MLDLTSQVLAVRITALVLTACLSCFAVQSLIQWAFQLFRTTDQFARYFYSDLDGESEEKAVQTITRWKQRVMITIFTTSAAAVALSRAVIITTREEWLHFGISVSIDSLSSFLDLSDCISFCYTFNVSPCWLNRGAPHVFHWACN